jgi:hypothetical protein
VALGRKSSGDGEEKSWPWISERISLGREVLVEEAAVEAGVEEVEAGFGRGGRGRHWRGWWRSAEGEALGERER